MCIRDRLYYEGTMDAATALPWVVKLTYTLDGAEISPDELGGKSGALSDVYKRQGEE